VAAMVADAGELTAIIVEGRDMPGVCWLAAWLNGRMVGVVGIETIVDAAVMRSLAVVEAMRGRGIGVALVAAARKAALTRGARRLYAISRDAAEYLVRFGFERVAPAVLIDDLTGTFIADYLEAHPEELARLATLRLDISRDGMIER
jgi:N-acetylglutamate synthase-like GNAT family acetyltransferase